MHYPNQSYIRHDPFSLMRNMMRNIDYGLSAPFNRPEFPSVNVWQNSEAVAVTAELPGVDISDIDITVRDNVLTLSGERAAPEAVEGAKWHRRERSYGSFTRAIRLPFQADSEKVEARFADGVLSVVVGRPDKDKPRRIEIKSA